MTVLFIERGASRCGFVPGLGGGIASWTVAGQAMLRSASTACIAARDPYGLASFPLVPFSNRIGAARFQWHGQSVQLQANYPPEIHAIHGVGFERVWNVPARDAHSALLSYTHVPDASWPWPFAATQGITVSERALRLDLAAVNTADTAVPLAFGHHPYFESQGAQLTFAADAVWSVGDDALPQRRTAIGAPFDFRVPTRVQGADIDHCYVGWQGSAAIAWQHRPLQLRILASPSLPAAVLFIRPGADAFCFEPVPHVNNALNLDRCTPAMPVVAPGGSFVASIVFEALPG